MAADDGGRKKPHKKNENNTQGENEDGEAGEENFSDPEDFYDDVTDEELLGDLLLQKPRENDNFDSLIVVDNIPQVGPERLEKLKNVISKIFQKFGDIVSVHYPMEDNKTKGYMFLEYSHPDHAIEAVKTTNGYKLDKQHTFIVNLFSDFDRYTGVPEEWEPPKPQPYKDVGNLRHWLLNKECHDQFSVIYEGGEKTMIVLNSTPEPTIVQERSRWTETYVKWSPQGTYLATMHQKGIALWGGEHFKQIIRFNHPGVQLIDFSPCERFVVTFSPMVTSKDNQESVIIWDMRSGQKRRGFQCDSSSGWPVFKWSADGQYFARMTPDTLSIYETPSCGLLEKKSLRLEGIRDFAWSPSSNVIAYWIPEADHNPARVVLLEVPSRTELRVRNLFNVADCKLHWQKSGDFLCVKVDRYSKMKKDEKNEQLKYAGVYYNFELFHVREKGIPVDTVECKETVSAFAWEPIGSKFAYIHGESQRINVSFYQITGDKVSLIKTLDKRQCNSIFWCPTGQFVVLAGLRSMNGTLEFVDTSDMTVMSPNPCEHFMATDIEWDPTGRYVTTAVSWWSHKVDNAYWIWNFQGRLIGKHSLDRFCQFLWRPKPPSLLNEKIIKDIKKNMKKYSAQFDIQDRMMLSKASKELVEKRRRLMDEFERFRAQVREVFNNQKSLRMALRKGIDTDELDSHVENFEEETIEFLVKYEETIIEDRE